MPVHTLWINQQKKPSKPNSQLIHDAFSMSVFSKHNTATSSPTANITAVKT